MKNSPRTTSPAKQVAGFIAKFDPAIAKLLRAALKVMRKRFPTAIEIVYDNYIALAIGWTPNGRTSEVIVSLAATPRGVSLYFTHGAKLPDPKHLLLGAGNQGRYLRVADVGILSSPDVESLLRAAIKLGKTPLPKIGKRHIIIKSISTKQRPRKLPNR